MSVEKGSFHVPTQSSNKWACAHSLALQWTDTYHKPDLESDSPDWTSLDQSSNCSCS